MKKTKAKRIIEMFAKGRSKLGISKELGCSRTYVYKVLNQQKNVPRAISDV